jgi:hypothetical protein
LAKESGMAVKTIKKATVKKTVPVPPKAMAGRIDKIDRAILSMTATAEKTSAAIVAITTELSVKLAESEAKLSVRLAESEAKLSVRLAESEAKMSAILAETNSALEKSMASLSASQKEMDISLQKSMARLSVSQEETNISLQKSMDKLSGNVGDLNNRLGEIVELVVLPGLMEQMNKVYGHKFYNVSPRKKFTADGRQYAEIDLFLENGKEVMAVEAKTRFTLGMVHDFVKRVELLRKHEIKAGLVGKTIYAAIAWIGIDANAKAFASKKGLYLVDIDRDNNNIKIKKPAGAIGKW